MSYHIYVTTLDLNYYLFFRYRLIRHSWNLSVHESLSVEISTQTSYNSKEAEDLALALKTTNLNKIHHSLRTEITLLNIAFLSDNWILTSDIVTPKYISLNSQESAHILFKCRRTVDGQENKYTSILLSSDQLGVPQLSSAFRTFARKSHLALLNAFNLSHETKKRDGTLILEWKGTLWDAVSRRSVYGHTCVPIEITMEDERLDRLISDTIIDLNTSINNEGQSEDNARYQVTFNILHPSIVKHDFKKASCCVIPVTLVLHNIVEDLVTVNVNTVDVRYVFKLRKYRSNSN